MGLCRLLFVLSGVGLAIFTGLAVRDLLQDAPVPVLPRDVWWGPGEPRPEDKTVRPFKIQVAEADLIDLKERLGKFLKKPITAPLENIGFQYGFNTDYLRTVVTYWKDEYKWLDRQKFLNGMPQYTTRVNGLKIHYIRITPRAPEGKRVLPLLLLHGWPGSIREFYDIIPSLIEPNDETDFIFEIIAPSLPGYGFSEGPAKPGMGPAQMAVVLNNFMEQLGFKKYYAQGGDWGALLVRLLGIFYPSTVLGVHSNMCGVMSKLASLATFAGSFYPRLIVEDEHQHLMYPWTKKFFYTLEESGYFHLQATKPDTIGTALGDTPAGLAAYILEKFSAWTNPAFKTLNDGGITKRYTLEALLDNIMIYWITNSITTSQRLYSEAFTHSQRGLNLDEVPITVPTACARFHHDILWAPEKLLRLKYYNLLHISDFPDGGHFAAWEHPNELAKDIFIGINKMEQYRKDLKIK